MSRSFCLNFKFVWRTLIIKILVNQFCLHTHAYLYLNYEYLVVNHFCYITLNNNKNIRKILYVYYSLQCCTVLQCVFLPAFTYLAQYFNNEPFNCLSTKHLFVRSYQKYIIIKSLLIAYVICIARINIEQYYLSRVVQIQYITGRYCFHNILCNVNQHNKLQNISFYSITHKF